MKDQQPTHLALVADGGTARLLAVAQTQWRRVIIELETFERASAHMPARELLRDRAGRSFESSGRSSTDATRTRHGVGDDYDPHIGEIERYVDSISERLVTLHRRGKLASLVLIAEPQLLGVLRVRLPAELQRLVKREISGDYVRASHPLLVKLIDAPE